jgi:hypothetical protein
VPGYLHFWPTSEVFAVYYVDLGRSAPAPGQIRLGALTTGLDELAAAGRRVTVRIDVGGAPSDPAR